MAVVLRAVLAALLVVALADGAAQPVLARGPRVPLVVRATIDSVTCNPGGEAGLSVAASSAVTGGVIKYAYLFVGEYRAVTDPAYAPFAWNAMTLANWGNNDSWRRGPTADSRTLVTGDPHTWNWRNHATGLWTAPDPDAWWTVDYTVQAGATWSSVRWYVHCADGTRIDAASLKEIAYTEEKGLR
jgi:hypothetical protein